MKFPKPKKRTKKRVDYKSIYTEIWEERPHECKVCSYPIREAKVHNFAHLKSKGSRPDLKTDKENIEVWCSSLDRNDDSVGCHELSHTNPKAFEERARNHNYNLDKL